MRRLLDSAAPGTASSSARKVDLTNDQDISDYLLGLRGNGYDTASESEGDSEAEGSDGAGGSSRKIELPADYGRAKKGETKAVRLVEIGPRMEMKLGKVVEGVVGGARGEGETVWHERSTSFHALSFPLSSAGRRLTMTHSSVFKSTQEKSQLKSTHAQKAAEKAARRTEQEANVQRKKDEAAAKEALKTSKRGKRTTAAAADEADDKEDDGEDESEDEIVHDYDGEDEFEFEDRVASNSKTGKKVAPVEEDSEDEDEMDDWDGEEDAGEVSSEDDQDGGASESSEDDDGPAPARPSRPSKKVRK